MKNGVLQIVICSFKFFGDRVGGFAVREKLSTGAHLIACGVEAGQHVEDVLGRRGFVEGDADPIIRKRTVWIGL